MACSTHSLPSAEKDADDPTTPVAAMLDEASAPSPRAPASSYEYLRGTSSADAVPLPDHLYTRGFLQGRHSDITVVAFDIRYKLHRLILDRAPFFSSAFSGPWVESHSDEITLHPEEIDSTITQPAFDLAIKKLYGYDISADADAHAVGLFATACWLELQDLVDMAVESILRQMNPSNIAPLIRLVTCNYYGRPGDRILDSAKAMLSRSAWEMPLKCWDGMPADIVREIVASDGLFVYTEWDRIVLAKRILDRRLRQAAVDAGLVERGTRPVPQAPEALRTMAVRSDTVYIQNSICLELGTSHHQLLWLSLYNRPEIAPLLVLLDQGIHYVHMEFEQLQLLKEMRDVLGFPVLPEKVISNALWQQLALRQKVLNAKPDSQTLGLCHTLPEPPTTSDGAFKGKQTTTVQDDDADSDLGNEGWDGTGKPRKFWIPSSDLNIVLGNGTDPVVTTSNSFQRHLGHANRLSATIQPEDAQWATDFASSTATMASPNARTNSRRPVLASGANAGQPKPFAYTEFPPFRFSAEFPNPRQLKEKKRVYSRTVSYAGSLWNIYIQKVRTAKNVQLGVYLHRAKERDTEEQQGSGRGVPPQAIGSFDPRNMHMERDGLLTTSRGPSRPMIVDIRRHNEEDTSGSGSDPDGPFISSENLFSPVLGWLSSPDAQAERSQSLASDLYDINDSDADEPASAYPDPVLPRGIPDRQCSRPVPPVLPPYVDRRPTIKTYFKIYSPSKGGRVLSIYESAPDRFNFSQSWGWKSSTLMLEDGGLLDDEEPKGMDEDSKERSEGVTSRREGGRESEGRLRFMVVIGNL